VNGDISLGILDQRATESGAVLAKNLTPKEIYTLISTDFEDVWNSVAWNPSALGRGNFLFAILAMALLEFACRLCSSDKNGDALMAFSEQLQRIDRKYFRRIYGLNISSQREFVLPHVGKEQTRDPLGPWDSKANLVTVHRLRGEKTQESRLVQLTK